MNEIKIICAVFVLMITNIYSQSDPAFPAPFDKRLSEQNIKSVWVENEFAEIYPVPVKAEYSDTYYNLYNKDFNPEAGIIVNTKYEKNAAATLNNQLSKYNYPAFPVLNSNLNEFENYKILIKFDSSFNELKQFGEQAYKINFKENEKVVVELSGGSEVGLIYASVSLAQLINRNENEIQLRKADVFDYPKFSKRIINSRPDPYHLTEDLDWMLRYKIECITFHNIDYSWYGPDDELKKNLSIYKKWNEEFGGVRSLLVLNLYTGDYDIEITNEDHLNQIKEFIKESYLHGVTRFMINADDSPPFKFGEGYILTSQKDKQKFSTMAEAHCWLMNNIYEWAGKNKFDLELMYCPGFYTYEEMHYGDMELFKNTPWENDAFGPLKRDLKIIGEKMNKDIEIMWTGPFVCTRVLTDEDISDWTNNLQGRVPFLFDNTIYSQLEFTTRSMFTAYENDFPKNFSRKTGGNGIFLNGEGVGETSRAQSMTANAYMWEEDRYNPNASLMAAMRNLYGSSNINLLLKYRDVELEFCKTIKQRELWYAADELWQSIRKTRFITEKNPFYYHQNYGRLKALRLQLKNSVPEPVEINEFKNKCFELRDIRKSLLNEIEKNSFYRLSYSLQSEMVNVPSFEEAK
ncbi:MAG: beta-N-acetylglucosaminidase domain-containing protein [Bacteroidetes bacterium]|nr:beta-N-acetylglucosaminidase domain-containing protein [Bacteroidota bacterium]